MSEISSHSETQTTSSPQETPNNDTKLSTSSDTSTDKKRTIPTMEERKVSFYDLSDPIPAPRLNEESSEFFEMTPEELKLIHRQEVQKSNQMKQFQSKSKKERERAQVLNQFTHTRIRVRFPDKTCVEGTFRTNEGLLALRYFIKQVLRNPELEFYLYTTPPPTRLEGKENFAIRKLVPGAIIDFSFESSQKNATIDYNSPLYHYLNDQYFPQVKKFVHHAPSLSNPLTSSKTTTSSKTPFQPKPVSTSLNSAPESRDTNYNPPINYLSHQDKEDRENEFSSPAPKWFLSGFLPNQISKTYINTCSSSNI